MAYASTKENHDFDVPRSIRGGRPTCMVASLKCKCGTIRHSLTPYLSDLIGPRDHEVRCYDCQSVLMIWLTSGRRF